MDPVVHFEMPYDDAARMSKFYQAAFGWQMQALGAQMGEYVLATTTPPDESGRPAMPGAISGGFFARNPQWPAQVPSVVIAVSDIRESMRNVKEAGLGINLGMSHVAARAEVRSLIGAIRKPAPRPALSESPA